MKKKYPQKIQEILKEAPLAYGMVVLLDYNNQSVGANELYRRWQRDKNKCKKPTR